MKFLRVTNWEEYQHYKDRNPPWIKLHNQLLDNYEFTCLQDASKAHLLAIWMLASRTNNKLPANAQWIGQKISATESVDIDLLVSCGFLEVYEEKQEVADCKQDASNVLQNPQVSDHQEAEERRGEEKGVPPSRESVREFFATLGAEFLTDEFIDHHQARDWKLSKGGKMKDWQAACRTWHRKDQEWNPSRYKPDPYATIHASQL